MLSPWYVQRFDACIASKGIAAKRNFPQTWIDLQQCRPCQRGRLNSSHAREVDGEMEMEKQQVIMS